MIANTQNSFLFLRIKRHTPSQNNKIITHFDDLKKKNMTLTGPLFPKDFYHMISKVNPIGELQFQK